MAAAAPRAAVPAAPAGQGGYVVQLSAQRSQEEAVASFQSFQGRYPSLLGGQQMIIRRKEIEGKGTFFGAQAGPFASQAEAAQLCSQLKAAGAPCMVQKN
jgi:cell division septation protein DedD